MNPTREQVLTATDAQLNEWAATVVMGWEVETGYSFSGDKVVFTPDGNSRYEPATDIAQAMKLVDKFRKQAFSLRRPKDEWVCQLLESSQGVISHWCDTPSKAITQACILAKLEV